MAKSKFMRIVLVVASALILLGVGLMSWMIKTENDRNNIKVDLSDGADAIKFDNLSLIPGEQCEYNVTLKDDHSKEYDLTLDFVELEEKTLKNFVRVKILANGELICDELLADLFENEDVVLSVDFNDRKTNDLKIIY